MKNLQKQKKEKSLIRIYDFEGFIENKNKLV